MASFSVKDISAILLFCRTCGEPTEYDLKGKTQAHNCRNPECAVSREAPQLPERGPENMQLQNLKQELRRAIDAPNQPDFVFKKIGLKFSEP
jgi:hypothetical protein